MENNSEAKALLQKYLAGKCTPEEEAQVLRWYYAFNDDDAPIDPATERHLLTETKSNVLQAVKATKVRRLLGQPFLRVAAMVLIAVGITWLYFNHPFHDIPPVTYSEVRVGKGHQKQVTLPDGTQVVLNAASTIRIPSNYNVKDRRIELTGEAFFEVIHDTQKPFQVQSGQLITRDIGTSFNIKAYTEDTSMQVTVVTGTVAVAAGKRELNNDLVPNQLLNYNPQLGQYTVTTVNAAHIAVWKDNQLYFDEMTIAQMAKVLERRFNIPILVNNNQNAECLYTVKFNNEPIEQVMNILSAVSGASWEKKPQQIIINTKPCKL